MNLAEALVSASSRLKKEDEAFFQTYFDSSDADSEALKEIFEDANLLIKTRWLNGEFIFDKKTSSWFFVV